MLLSDMELRSEVNAGRIVFEPTLSDIAFQSASIDLSLNRVFWRPNVPTGPGISLTVDVEDAIAYQYFESFEDDQIQLAPGDFVLGETREAISLPPHLAALIEGKSGRARHGLIVHCTAPHIAPGWGSPVPKRITLELANLGPVPLTLRAGIGIAQLMVLRLGSPSLNLYSGKHRAMGSA